MEQDKIGEVVTWYDIGAKRYTPMPLFEFSLIFSLVQYSQSTDSAFTALNLLIFHIQLSLIDDECKFYNYLF